MWWGGAGTSGGLVDVFLTRRIRSLQALFPELNEVKIQNRISAMGSAVKNPCSYMSEDRREQKKMKYSDYRCGRGAKMAFSISFSPITAAITLRIIQWNGAFSNTRHFKKERSPFMQQGWAGQQGLMAPPGPRLSRGPSIFPM